MKMMTENGDRKVQTTLLTMRVPPPGLPEVQKRSSPWKKVGDGGTSILSSDYDRLTTYVKQHH